MFRSTWVAPALLSPMGFLAHRQGSPKTFCDADLKQPLLKVTSNLSLKTFRGEVLKALISFSAVTLKLFLRC